MHRESVVIEGVDIPVYRRNTIVVGTGAAGYNAALRLHGLGQTDIAVITEGINMGTSRNTGSDKQTYYKLSLSGDVPDSPALMAADLFAGGCVDGDVALAEAALSVRAFLHLCELGVRFPTNRYGEYVGYKTDHDARARATSVGPLTSREMTERLQEAVQARAIDVWDGHHAISILKDVGGCACGILTLNKKDMDREAGRFSIFACRNIVWATGGPAGIYEDTVYPAGHTGASGIAFEAGAKGRNLTEWQYGLASVAPRWNVSGTYMQVLPRFISIDAQGTEREFLAEHFADGNTCLSQVFRKGYEWPFDSRKAQNGSSIIDLLVFRECVQRGRRVYLDYRSNPFGQENLDFAALDEDARAYLQSADACFGTPVERLLHMNAPAHALYLSKGVDLGTQMLEIAMCAQHNNGGLDIDLWWRTSVEGLYAAGEAAGSHGVYRPGGSALNAGQVGSLRAAQHIAAHGQGDAPDTDALLRAAEEGIAVHIRRCRRMLGEKANVGMHLHHARQRMSAVGASIRDVVGIEKALAAVQVLLRSFDDIITVADGAGLLQAYRLRDCLLAQRMYLGAMLDYVSHGGGSRGSAIYLDSKGVLPHGLDDTFRFLPDDGGHNKLVQLVQITSDGEVDCHWRERNMLPEGGGFFENVWRSHREHGNIM